MLSRRRKLPSKSGTSSKRWPLTHSPNALSRIPKSVFTSNGIFEAGNYLSKIDAYHSGSACNRRFSVRVDPLMHFSSRDYEISGASIL